MTGKANRTILVVEDSPTERKIVTTFLRSQGYRILTAIDGDQVLSLAEREQPDLIVLDILLPKKNGFEVCRELKTAPATQAIKVLFLSSKNQSSDRFWGMRQGADRYLGKPWDEEELLSEVAELLGEVGAAYDCSLKRSEQDRDGNGPFANEANCGPADGTGAES